MACSCGKDTCGCSAPEMVYLKDEAGLLHSFYISDKVNVNQQEYVLLAGVEEADLMAILRAIPQADGSVQYANIQSETEWAMLQEALGQPS